jgi:hypothetical protein
VSILFIFAQTQDSMNGKVAKSRRKYTLVVDIFVAQIAERGGNAPADGQERKRFFLKKEPKKLLPLRC